MQEPILEVRNLKVYFPIARQPLTSAPAAFNRAVDDISFTLHTGETLGLVGESGCGKSTTARAILQLYRPTDGSISFMGRDLAKLRGRQLRGVYSKLQIIYQDPYASLDPRMTIGNIVGEPLKYCSDLKGKNMHDRVAEILTTVGLDPSFINRYPHEFSGGQRQRVGIARALAVNPSVIICDEPVSALDVSIRSQIINLLEDLQRDFGFSYLFIAHDLSVVRHISDRVAVMYLGRIAEIAPSSQLYKNPLHPYTRALLSAIPIPDPAIEASRKRIILHGDISTADASSPGCNFYPRCPIAVDSCKLSRPELTEISPGRHVACFRAATTH